MARAGRTHDFMANGGFDRDPDVKWPCRDYGPPDPREPSDSEAETADDRPPDRRPEPPDDGYVLYLATGPLR